MILAFTGGYVLAQKSEEIEWLGWAVVAKPRGGPDAGIYGKRPLRSSSSKKISY
jgi:hypothetical protein